MVRLATAALCASGSDVLISHCIFIRPLYTLEMTRLEDSIARLIATQDTLKEVIDAEERTGNVDRDLTLAYDENVDVM
jgi:hypothetical protein